jgi:hypothetical protein
MLDRCYTFLDTAMEGQGKEVVEYWQRSRNGLVDEAIELLPTEPERAVGILKRVSHGCSWLLNQWTEYQGALLRYGYWPMKLWPDIVRLTGADTDFDRIGASDEAFTMALYNFQCQPQPATEQIAALCTPLRRPRALAHRRLPEALPVPEECRQRFGGMVAKIIEELQKLEAELRGQDCANLESLLKRTLVLNDCESSRQFLRYHKEWGSLFFRAIRVLPLTLERDASGFFDDLAASYDDELQTLSPRERVPEGRVTADAPPSSESSDGRAEGWARASAPPSAEASDGPAEGRVRADAPPSAGVALSPTEDEAGADRCPHPGPPLRGGRVEEAGEHREPVAEEPPRSDSSGGALPTSADPAVAEAAAATDRVGFPDPPSSLPAAMTQVDYGSKVVAQSAIADGPGSWSQPGSAPVPRGPQLSARLISDGLPPPDRAPPTVRGSPQSHDDDPRAVP